MSVDEIVRLLDQLLAHNRLLPEDQQALHNTIVNSGLVDYLSRDALALLVEATTPTHVTHPRRPIRRHATFKGGPLA